MGIFLAHTYQLIGRVSLSNVVRGAWESCTLGISWTNRSMVRD